MQIVETKKNFGAAVRSERTRLGLSQETLAERASLHRTYAHGHRKRRSQSLAGDRFSKLSSALGVSIEALFARAEVREQLEQHATLTSQLVDVLLVEDEAADAELTLEAFKRGGLTNRVLVVRDGAAALDFVFCRRQYAHRRMAENPQVILLDLNLPKVHGLEVLRKIKEDRRTRHLQVVVLTISRKDEHINRALELGAAGYIVKPVDFQNFSKIMPKLSYQWALLDSTLRTPA